MVYYTGALSQKTYPGVGDIDDCWVVATIWAIRRQTHQMSSLPSATLFRAAAGDPDDGRSDGGTLWEIHQAATRLYPHINFVKFARSYGWSYFEGYLNRGYTASVALRSSYLPSTYRYGFYGTHQVAVFKRNGVFYIMNPLQAAGTAPRAISESALQKAIYAFANGWVMAELVPPMNLGTFSITPSRLPRAYRRYKRTASGGWTSELRTTRGWSGVASAPESMLVSGKYRRMSFISTGMNSGYYVEYAGTGRRFVA